MGRAHTVVRRDIQKREPVPINRKGSRVLFAKPAGLSRIVKNFLALHSLEAVSCYPNPALEKGWYDVNRYIGPTVNVNNEPARRYTNVCRISRYDRPMDTVADIIFALEAGGLSNGT